jgi:hypothetical protein
VVVEVQTILEAAVVELQLQEQEDLVRLLVEMVEQEQQLQFQDHR